MEVAGLSLLGAGAGVVEEESLEEEALSLPLFLGGMVGGGRGLVGDDGGGFGGEEVGWEGMGDGLPSLSVQ